MDLFEKAHVSKKHTNKPKREEETVKKQLKLMLQGYKTSNSELIKEAEFPNVDVDDSLSVSGFSDLNLTLSSSDENTSVREKYDEVSDTEKSCSFDEETSIPVTNQNESESVDDLLSECSVKDHISELHDNSSYESDSSKNIYSVSCVSTSSSNGLEETSDYELQSSNGSSVFDPNGKLASKILEKLKKNEKQCKNDDFDNKPPQPRGKKRKLKQKGSEQAKINPLSSDSMRTDAIIKGSCPSPSFVSITATDVEPVRFGDILGDYKHSTVRILPSSNHNTSIENMNIFTEECKSADIVVVDSEVNDECVLSKVNNSMENPNVFVGKEPEQPIEQFEELFDKSIDESMHNPMDELVDTANESHNTEETDKLNNHVYFGRNNCVFVLKHPSELHFHGKVIVQRLSGHMVVGGHIIDNDECSIIAPKYTYAQCIRTRESISINTDLSTKLTEAGLLPSDVEEIIENVEKDDGVLLLKPLKSPIMDFVENNFKANVLFKSVTKETILNDVSNFLDCSIYTMRPSKLFKENPAWDNIFKIKPKLPFKGLVCGGKNSGKSTFLRHYVNRLVKRGPVLYVDLDPGQCEFTVAGHVSITVVDTPIFGPGFTHLKTPIRALNIGMISVMDNIPRYVNAVKNIVAYGRDNFSHLPWVINTMGMTNSLGLKLIILIIALTEPNFILQYVSKNIKKGFASRFTPNKVMDLYRKFKYNDYFKDVWCPHLDYLYVKAPDAESVTMIHSIAPRDERYLNFLAYFGQLTYSIKPNGWLLDIVPYEVKIEDLYVAVNTVFKDYIAKVINGKVVGLCKHSPSPQCKDKVFSLSEQSILCLGNGLIRGVDFERQLLYVITPMAEYELKNVNAILYADWVPDIKNQESHLPNGTVVPFRAIAEQQSKKLMVAPRRRFNPLQLIRMTRK